MLRTALVAVAVVVADQVTKAIVRARDLALRGASTWSSGIKLINTRNTGVAFSMFSGGGPLVVIVALVALGALLAFFLTHLHRRLVWLPTGLLLGGAAGNLIDRDPRSARSPTSSSSRTGRRSTSPTSASRSA